MDKNKVDATISAVCDWVQEELNQTKSFAESMILPEMVKALAELVVARASMN